MAELFTLTGEDTLTIFDRVLNDFADGDVTTLAFPNELITVKTGKNGNSIFAKNATGKNVDIIIRLSLGSADDRFLQSKLTSMNNDLPSFALASGEFVKRAGNGQGVVINNTYTLKGGAFVKPVDTKENVEGDTEQGVAVYTMKFAIGDRSIG